MIDGVMLNCTGNEKILGRVEVDSGKFPSSVCDSESEVLTSLANRIGIRLVI
jgi:hypothetical protein